MSYGSAADDERMLSYAAPKEAANTTSTSHQTSTHTSVPMPSSASPVPPPTNSEPVSIIGLPSATTDRVSAYARTTWEECRPWNEFYSTAAISIPPFSILSDRFSTNLHMYRANYQVLAVFWLLIFFVGSIPSFLLAALLFFLLERWCWCQALKNGNKLSHRDTVITGFAALIVVWITGMAEQALLSLGLSSLFIAAHAALHEPATIETEIATV